WPPPFQSGRSRLGTRNESPDRRGYSAREDRARAHGSTTEKLLRSGPAAQDRMSHTWPLPVHSLDSDRGTVQTPLCTAGYSIPTSSRSWQSSSGPLPTSGPVPRRAARTPVPAASAPTDDGIRKSRAGTDNRPDPSRMEQKSGHILSPVGKILLLYSMLPGS